MKKMLLLLTLLASPVLAHATDAYSVVFKAQGTFADVRDQVQSAIEGKGLKINHSNQVGEMLERTGKDLGATKQIFGDAEQFEFCSAVISREMMEADPHAIAMCPYIISVYTIPGDKTVYIAYRKPPASSNPALKKALGDVQTLLTSIIKDAL
jgi:uncharacterized protein (DUF302 family)